MFEMAVVIVLVCVVSFFVAIGIVMLHKIWTPDPVASARYQQLKELARKANKGDTEAIKDCQSNTDIKVGKFWRPWGYQKHYSVHPTALYACFQI
ncbi:MAG: hypothetical protein M0P64_00175 [Candidatus Pacebacteria bacterium]|jgi:hypothetical protein|nr:hypothetical protein [Candidatus Paceibacterota bacterium]